MLDLNSYFACTHDDNPYKSENFYLLKFLEYLDVDVLCFAYREPHQSSKDARFCGTMRASRQHQFQSQQEPVQSRVFPIHGQTAQVQPTLCATVARTRKTGKNNLKKERKKTYIG